VWFTEGAITNRIGRITLDGAITEYSQGPVQTRIVAPPVTGNAPSAPAYPGWLAAGPDGAIWFTEAIGDIVRFSIPTATSKARRPF
jgi:hypothetical protein